MIDGNAQLAVGTAVTILVEISKTMMPADKAKRLGPYLALAFSLAMTMLWIVSAPAFPPSRLDVWALAMGWLQVFATSVGVYHGAKLVGKASEA